MSRRTVLITGGNRGLGLQTGKVLARQGLRVVLGSRDPARGEVAAAALCDEGLEVEAVELDVSSDASIEAALAELERRGLEVDVLVNNAGTILEDSSDTMAPANDADLMARELRTNVLGAYTLMRAVLPLMNERGYGRIVNVSSGMGGLAEMGGGWPAYRTSKAALNALTRILHAETRGDVKVNSVCPGWVRTDMGGSGADRSVEEGAEGIVWAATLPTDGPSGGFFRDGKPTPW